MSGFSRYHQNQNDLRGLFDRYDRDRSGSITFDELRNMYNEMGQPINDSALAYLQNTYDKNRDGRLSYPEFHEFITGRPFTGATLVTGPAYASQSYATAAPVYASQSYATAAPVYATTAAPVYSTSRHTTSTVVTTQQPGYTTQSSQYNPAWVSSFGRYAQNPNDLRGLFDRYDRDRSGSITFDELRNMYNETGTPISDSALAYLQATYDRNRDGRLSYAEFHEFIY